MPDKQPIQHPESFGLAAHLAFHALVDRMILSGAVKAEDVRIALLQAMNNADMHKIASPFPAIADEAKIILQKDKAFIDETYR